jgi:hypothetical protein
MVFFLAGVFHILLILSDSGHKLQPSFCTNAMLPKSNIELWTYLDAHKT